MDQAAALLPELLLLHLQGKVMRKASMQQSFLVEWLPPQISNLLLPWGCVLRESSLLGTSLPRSARRAPKAGSLQQ